MVAIACYRSGSQGTADGSAAGFDVLPTAPDAAATPCLSDTFGSNAIDTMTWQVQSGTVTEANGLDLTVPGTLAPASAIESLAAISFRPGGSMVTVRLGAFDATVANLVTELDLVPDAGAARISLAVTGGSGADYAVSQTTGTGSGSSDDNTYSSVTDQFIGIQRANNEIQALGSTNGQLWSIEAHFPDLDPTETEFHVVVNAHATTGLGVTHVVKYAALVATCAP